MQGRAGHNKAGRGRAGQGQGRAEQHMHAEDKNFVQLHLLHQTIWYSVEVNLMISKLRRAIKKEWMVNQRHTPLAHELAVLLTFCLVQLIQRQLHRTADWAFTAGTSQVVLQQLPGAPTPAAEAQVGS